VDFARTARALDFGEIRRELAGFCKTPAGAKICFNITPADNPAEAERLLDLTAELLSLTEPTASLFPRKIDDPLPVLESIGKGVLPEPDGLKRILLFCEQLERLLGLRPALSSSAPGLAGVIAKLDPLEETTRFFRQTFDGEGMVKPTASALMVELESRIESLKNRIERKAKKLLSRGDVENVLQETYITVRNDRIVLPVKAEFKNIFPGIIHGISSTEHTAFIEPQELVSDNNELQSAVSEREEEINRLLRVAAELLRKNGDAVRGNWRVMGELDAVSARALFSRKIGGNRPRFAENDSVNIRSLRHPMMVMRGEKPHPNRLELDDDERALLVSGPNAGGKTVLLKSLGLTAVLPACGIFPPVDEGSSFPFAGRVFAIVGDEQSIEDGQSTFSAQLSGIKAALDSAKPGDWVIVDEILNGTDPEQASALAMAVIEEFLEKGCRAFVSTHLPNLKISAQRKPGMVNGAMSLDETGRPSFRFEKGHPGISYPFAIASAVGLPEQVIGKARGNLTSSHDLYNEALEELRGKSGKLAMLVEENESLAEENRRLKEELERRLEETERELEKFENEKRKLLKEEVKKTRRELAELIEKADKSDRKARAETARKLKEREDRLVRKIRQPESVPLEKVGEGGDVWIIPLDKSARLVKISPEGRAEVVCGEMRMTLDKKDLIGIKPGRTERKIKKPAIRQTPIIDEEPAEISLLGFTFDESLAMLEPFLDRHLALGSAEVTVIHGKGVLKEKVEKYLHTLSFIESVQPAHPSQGGTGASIVIFT